ncbi:hypothetical protein [Lactiplantibacillus pentosus]|uniref:hypothetical protein n=1 Tax=Lactiplantibacillus pentosus TaxID=1589 RepID=UPI001E2C69BA|nr:hypothetical protein [Lactiplantibacillus pentosus]
MRFAFGSGAYSIWNHKTVSVFAAVIRFCIKDDKNVLVSKFKSGQLRPAGNSASKRKFAVVAFSYAGFQAFCAMAGNVVDTDLSRQTTS